MESLAGVEQGLGLLDALLDRGADASMMTAIPLGEVFTEHGHAPPMRAPPRLKCGSGSVAAAIQYSTVRRQTRASRATSSSVR
jgi:hypothetical protein